MSKASSSLLLSSKEKRAIDDILTQAEEEVDQTKIYDNINAIDSQCKRVWPEWDPPKNVVPPLNISSRKNSSKLQLSMNNQSSILKSKGNEATIVNGSPIRNKNTKNEHIQFKPNKFSEHELDPKVIAEEIDALKKEVRDLMEKINKSIKNPELSSSAMTILQKVKAIQIPSSEPLKEMEKAQMNKKIDIPFKKEVIVSHQDVEKLNFNLTNNQQNNITNQPTNSNNGQQSQQPKTLFVEQFQLPLRVRTKEQTKSAISQVQKEIKSITKENIALRKQYREIRKELSETRSQCKALQNSLSRSEAIRTKMLTTFGPGALTEEPILNNKF